MRFIALLLAVFALTLAAPINPAAASIYDSNVIAALKLTGAQKKEMQKVISRGRSERNQVFKKHGIDPNAKPDMSLLQRASSELMAIRSRQRAAAAKILNAEQLRQYDAVIRETQERVMSAF